MRLNHEDLYKTVDVYVYIYTFSILSNLLARLPVAIEQSDWSVRSLEWEAIVSNVAESSPRLKNSDIGVENSASIEVLWPDLPIAVGSRTEVDNG